MFKILLTLIFTFMSLSVWSDSAGRSISSSPDPAIQELIEQLGLRESATASRELPGWSPPKKIVVRQGRPEQLADYQAIAPGVEFVMVDSNPQQQQGRTRICRICRSAR